MRREMTLSSYRRSCMADISECYSDRYSVLSYRFPQEGLSKKKKGVLVDKNFNPEKQSLSSYGPQLFRYPNSRECIVLARTS